MRNQTLCQLERRLAHIKSQYSKDQELRSKTAPGTAGAILITARQKARIIEIKRLDSAINQRPKCN